MFNMEAPGCIDDESIGPVVRGCRDDFDFTLKFERTILSILPAAIFVILAAIRILYLLRSPTMVEATWFRFLKLAVNATYTTLSLVLLALSVSMASGAGHTLIASTSLSFIAAFFICAVSYLEHTRSPRPSILIALFLIPTVLFDVAQTRSIWLAALNYDDLNYAKVFTTTVAVKAVVLVLESQHKSKCLLWDHKEHSPEESTGIWGLGALFWLNSLLLNGYRKLLKVRDLYPLDRNLSADELYSAFTRCMEGAGPPGQKYMLPMVLAKTLAKPLMMPIAGRAALSCFQFCQPFLIQSLLDYLQSTQSSANTGYGLIGAAIIIYSGIALSTTFYWYYQERAMFMARGCLASAVYRKTTQSKLTAAGDSAAVTLMSTDVERIRIGFLNLQECWINPIEIAVACYLLERQLGAAFVAPIIVVVCCVFVGFFVTRTAGPRQKTWMGRIQRRIGLTANVISNMKNLKISGLTEPVEVSIQGLRLDDLEAGTHFRMAQVHAAMLGFIPLFLAPVFTFAVTSATLDVTTIFTSTSYLLLLTQPLTQLFQVVPGILAGFACLSRIQAFLEKEPRQDFREYSVRSSTEKDGIEPIVNGIKIVNGSFGWVKNEFKLKNINTTIPASCLTIIVGPITSGKSTLCKTLLGEVVSHQGRVILGSSFRKIGYCDQTPFLLNVTIRQNIIGNAEYDKQRYAEVIEATMLGKDLSLLAQGDRSKVGSNGITLSGGQKQRVSIARALYLQSDLLIFDDVLSGLDADTGEAVFERVFGPHGMLKQRNATVVLCTHSIRHLPDADHIVALGSDGTLVEEGSFEELLTNNKYVHSLGIKNSSRHNRSGDFASSIDSETMIEIGRSETKTSLSADGGDESSRQLGDPTVYKHYFGSIGVFWMSVFFLIGIAAGFLFNFPTIWQKYWSEDISSPAPSHTNSYYIGIFSLLQFLTLMSFYGEILLGLKTLVMISGSALHKAALRTVIAAPLKFFATTDSGVILNFFSQDMTLIDSQLPVSVVNFSIDGWTGVGSAAVIASSSPYIVIAYPFLLAVLFGIQKFYLRTSRQLRLLDLEAKSPLYTHFLDTIKGVATFRAFDWMADGVAKNSTLLEYSQRPAYLLAMIQRWLMFVLNMVVMILAVIVVSLATQLRSSYGFTGASLVALMTFGESIGRVIRTYTMLETSIGAVARLKSFSEKTMVEDQPSETTIPPESWPQKGRIEVKEVSATYEDVQAIGLQVSGIQGNEPTLAISNLSLTINPGQKIAICGRSGSGKSSIILLLLRLLEPLPNNAGNMYIDGIALNTINRSTLRRRIIGVPQDAVFLPDGTSFRANLDPFNVSTDEECQVILETVSLWPFVSQQGGLEGSMTSDTLSQGQKQLFSLARAMVRKRVRSRELAAEVGDVYLEGEKDRDEKISNHGGVLLLDEVSSSVDIDTDRAMQKVIHREFAGYTIVMVSHRLEMIMDFDQVLVMDAGSIVETGVPKELVETKGSRFRDLWLVGHQE